MDSETLRAWLALQIAPGIGPATLRKLISRFGGARAAVDASAAALEIAGLAHASVEAIKHSDVNEIARLERWLEADSHHLLTPEHPNWPNRLDAIDAAPTVLFATGDTDLLTMPSLAIVGSRNPTADGKDNARAFARYLASNGMCIVSGLASGIDAAAHEGALDADGATIGVLGTGPDIAYPRLNALLQERVCGHGIVISEYRPGTAAQSGHFPARNRIISGLSLGTLVVEATPRSGSLITARLAGEQGRSVFAIPGSIHNPMARGCHQLIRQGALLVEQASDIFLELGEALGERPAPERELETESVAPDPDYLRVLDAMDWAPVSLDSLVTRTGLTAAELSSMLLIMELEGTIEQVPGTGFLRRGRGRKTP
ncbi:MAG: DNA-processing protein DprA [Pseudomonadota bacterium]